MGAGTKAPWTACLTACNEGSEELVIMRLARFLEPTLNTVPGAVGGPAPWTCNREGVLAADRSAAGMVEFALYCCWVARLRAGDLGGEVRPGTGIAKNRRPAS